MFSILNLPHSQESVNKTFVDLYSVEPTVQETQEHGVKIIDRRPVVDERSGIPLGPLRPNLHTRESERDGVVQTDLDFTDPRGRVSLTME